MLLHLCNDFAGSTVHAELYRRFDQAGIEQVVYCPIRNAALTGNNAFDGNSTEIIFSPLLKKYHRLWFHQKIRAIVHDLEQKVDLPHVDCIHATTLFSDGAGALKLKKKYGIPYIVAVRNSDINAFMKYAPLLLHLHREVVREAEKVIFISPNLKRRFISHHTLKGLTDTIEQKALVIPNGLNDFWFNNLSLEKRELANPFSVVYVGKFDNNKNVERLIHAFLSLKEKHPESPLHLDLVGGDGEREAAVLQLVDQHKNEIQYHGKIFDKQLLMDIYRQNRVFAMVSKKETFGLVYIEALSQGLNVLYTRNEGIDGLFNIPVGEKTDPLSVSDIENALGKLLFEPADYTRLQAEDFERFRWNGIAQEYLRIYESIKK